MTWRDSGGPGATHTPITYADATLVPARQVFAPWAPDFSVFVYVLTGHGTAGPEGRPIEDGELIVFGPGDHIVVGAANGAEPLDVLLLGGLPIRAPVSHYGPFVMNNREEILPRPSRTTKPVGSASIPADQLAPRNFA